MTENENRTLIASAAKFYTLGIEVEKRRNRLRKLAGKKIPYESSRTRIALAEFVAADEEWKRLEREHLTYRASVTGQEEIA